MAQANRQGGVGGKREEKIETTIRTYEFKHARGRSVQSARHFDMPLGTRQYPAVTQISPRRGHTFPMLDFASIPQTRDGDCARA
jgi:hypothetical protein